MKDTEFEELDLAISAHELAELAGPASSNQQPDYYDGDAIEPLDDVPDY